MGTIHNTGSDLVTRLAAETMGAWQQLADMHEPTGHRCDACGKRGPCAPRRIADLQLAS